MSKGGNAVDAAIATMVYDGTVCLEYMSLGGGFLISYYHAATKEVIKINAREMAPGAAKEDMFVKDHTKSITGSVVLTAVISFLVAFSQSPIIDDKPDPKEPLPESDMRMGEYNKFAVVAKGDRCSQIGVDVMTNGGNAVDAAIATMLCTGVMCPEFMGLGGGFMMSYYDAKTKTVMKINAREMAPGKADENMFVEDRDKSIFGGLAVAVPGQLKGYQTVYNRFGGKVLWESLFKPSIDLCKEGIKIGKNLKSNLDYYENLLRKDPLLKQTFFDENNETVKKEGDIYTMPLLAKTMETVAKEGADALYNGSLTPQFLKDLESIGSIITEEDLKNYTVEVVDSSPVKLKRGLTLHVAKPPGSSMILSYILRILDGFLPTSSVKPAVGAESMVEEEIDQFRLKTRGANDQHCFPYSFKTELDSYNAYENEIKDPITRLDGTPTSNELDTHLLVEAYKFAYAERTHLGDHIFEDTIKTYKKITSDQYINGVRNKILYGSTSVDPKYYGAEYDTAKNHGTSNIVVIDEWGNVVVATSSLNLHFGCGRTSLSTGIILNSQMNDFSIPGVINAYGLFPSPANFIKPRKRPMSSICPSIFTDQDDNFVLGLGASGGSKITLAVAYVSILYLWCNKTLKEAIDKPRIYHQLMPMEIEYEYGVTNDIVQKLRSYGHTLIREPTGGSSITAIAKKPSGKIYAMPDFRGREVTAGN